MAFTTGFAKSNARREAGGYRFRNVRHVRQRSDWKPSSRSGHDMRVADPPDFANLLNPTRKPMKLQSGVGFEFC
jgi:hypothetical protein